MLHEFHKLVCHNIFLRYADYYGQISHLRYNAPDLVPTSGVVLLNLNWQEIWSQLEAEAIEMTRWRGNTSFLKPDIPPPKTPLTDRIRSLSIQCRITLLQARFQIQEYVQRCNHTIRFEKIEHAFRAGNILFVVRRLVGDREMIEKGVFPDGVRGKELVEAVDWYESKWFEKIKVDENEVGEREVVDYRKTKWALEYLESREREKGVESAG